MDRHNLARTLVAAGLAAHAFFLPVSIAGTQMALAVAAAGVLIAPPRPLRTPLDWPVLAFLAVAIGSDLISPFGPPPLLYATLWRPAIGFFVVTHGLRLLPREWPARLLLCAALGAVIASAVGLVQYRTGLDVVHLLGLREQARLVEAPGVPGRYAAMGFFYSRLGFGHVLSVLLPLFGGALAALAVPRRTGWVLAAACVLGLAAVAVTFDRGAYLGLLVAALVIAVRGRKVVIGAVAALLVLAALHPAVRGRAASSFSSVKNADRVFIWSRALEIIADHPLHGIGFGNYQRVCGLYYDRVDPAFPMRTWAHNLELSTLAETGPLGLLAMLWIWIAAAVALWKRRGEPLATGALAALACWFAVAQVHDLFIDNKVMYALWFALGLALAPREGSPPARAG